MTSGAGATLGTMGSIGPTGTTRARSGSNVEVPQQEKQLQPLPTPRYTEAPSLFSGSMRNVGTFLWRTLYIQAVRRHYIATAVELIAIAAIFYLCLHAAEEVPPLSPEGRELPVEDILDARRPDGLIYGPNTTYNTKLMEAVAERVGALPPPSEPARDTRRPSRSELVDDEFLGFDVDEGGFSAAAARGEQEKGDEAPKTPQKPLVVHSFEDADMVHTFCRQTLEEAKKIKLQLLCVELHSDDQDQGADDASIKYTVYAPTYMIGFEPKEFPLGATGFTFTTNIKRAMAYQYIIDTTHLEIQRNERHIKPEEMNMTIEELPGWVFAGTGMVQYRMKLVLAIYLGFLITLIRRINAIELEFSTGLAEHQGILGMSGAQFFLGHFLTTMVYEVVEGAIFLSVMYLHTGKSYAAGVDISLMVAGLGLFHLNHALFILTIAWIFPKGWAGLILGILATIAVPSISNIGKIFLPIPSYITEKRRFKLLSALLPNTAFAGFLRIVFLARDYEGGADWSLVTRRVLDRDNVTIMEIWVLMLVVAVAMLLLAWYLSKVLPWSSENPQSPLFFLSRAYWTSEDSAAPEIGIMDKDPAHFEVAPSDVRPIIEVRNLTKVFDDKPALNGLDLKVYESKVTVLLGHNGAGKTTLMSILTGIKGPTSGMARVCGYNAATQRDEIRRIVSLCQQSDIFFDDMTCVENLLYFGSLKGTDMEDLRKAIVNTLKVVNMEKKSDSMPSELSGGMKRRLSMAIAIVSNPKVVILDEPTTGMDPETRRNVWDVIQLLGKQRTVLLSSHDMEEADAIGDYIIVMALGRAVCAGSTTFLKKACGVGYKIALAKATPRFNLPDTLVEIRKAAPNAEVEDDKQEEVVIALRTLDNTGFAAMFKGLEQSSEKLGIASIGVTVASMKDVYLKINMDWAPGGKDREEEVNEVDIAGVCMQVTKTPSAPRRFCALFLKRAIYLGRSWGIIIVGLVIPLVLQLLSVNVTSMPSLKKVSAVSHERNGTFFIELRLGAHFAGSEVFLEESPASSVSENFRMLIESEDCIVHSLKNARTQLRDISHEDFGYYIRTYPMAAVFLSNVTVGMPNPTSVIALPIVLNMLNTAQLRMITGQPAVRMRAMLAYLNYEIEAFTMLLTLVVSIYTWFYWAVLPCFSYALAFAAFAAFPVAERVGGARDVQLMTGISGVVFVLSNLVFDYLCYVIIMIPWWLIHYAFSDYSVTTAAAFVLTFACLGPNIICVAYLIAERAESIGGAISAMVLLIFVGGLASVIAYTVVGGVAGLNVRPAFIFFPPYAIIACLVKITQMENKASTCALLPAGARAHSARLLESTATGYAPGYMAVNNFPMQLVSDACDVTTPFSFTGDGILLNLLFLLGQGLVFFCIMSFILSGYFIGRREDVPDNKQEKVDEDVEEERRLVNTLRDKKDFSGHALVAWNLHKLFGPLHAVRGVHLALRPGECFGLLGVNGAGKTTTFQMLAGLASVSHGDAYTENATLSQNLRKWQSQISYCFQLGGLLDRLNAYEYLYLIGRLRGIGEGDLNLMVNSVITVVDLKPHADKECGVYSGGNRRKLSIGAALLGLPPIVFLDEPYAGVDVVSRTKIFKAISLIKQKSRTAVVLTSHNMDECEISCDRLTIMVQGHMMCLGTLQHLRSKFGKGYRLEFMLKHEAGVDAMRFKEAVPGIFPGINLTDFHENVFSYHLEERIPWSDLFQGVATLQKEYALEHAMVGDNTLEQLFIAFAKSQELHSTQSKAL